MTFVRHRVVGLVASLLVWGLASSAIPACGSDDDGQAPAGPFMRFVKDGDPVAWTICKYWASSGELEVYSGPSPAEDEEFEFRLDTSAGPLTPGTYTDDDLVTSMHYYGFGTIVEATVTIARFDSTAGVIEGTFSATLTDGTDTTIITNGEFRAFD